MIDLIREAALAALTIISAADVACSESGYNYDDGAGVLQVVRNRAGSGWARYDGTLLNALWSPKQHAHNCRLPLSLKHWKLGVQFYFNSLGDVECLSKAMWYCGKYDRPGSCHRRGARVLLQRRAHHYYK